MFFEIPKEVIRQYNSLTNRLFTLKNKKNTDMRYLLFFMNFEKIY